MTEATEVDKEELSSNSINTTPTLQDSNNSTPPIQESSKQGRGALAREEEEKGLIKFINITNDGKRDSMIILTGLKNIYQKQLPKMPREYIARLVYDRKHSSMAIIKNNGSLQTLGGITYRVFKGRQFAEIVFCAITSTEQVKGYGSHLMNHLKDYCKQNTDVVHFLTYADNYAVGYFKKQGFTADITLDRSIWGGFIKDYEGGTIMQCSMVPKIEYLRVNEIVAVQKKSIFEKIQEIVNSVSTVYPGLSIFKRKREEGEEEFTVDPYDIPGVKESGWNPEMGKQTQDQNPLYPLLRQLLSDLNQQSHSWPFKEPVDAEIVPGYYDVISNPMDLMTMENRIEAGYYVSLDDFIHDFSLIIDNCKKFNDVKSVYVKCANKLDLFFKGRLKVVESSHNSGKKSKGKFSK